MQKSSAKLIYNLIKKKEVYGMGIDAERLIYRLMFLIDSFEKSWKSGMTLNAAIKLGLEALQESLEDSLNHDTVEISIVDVNGYQKLNREDTLKHLSKVS